MRLYALNEAGEPVECDDWLAWAMWFENANELRQVDDDYVTIEDGTVVRVSTVFMGIDSFARNPPLLWETLVFGGDLDGHGGRYSSKAAALAGHREALALVLSGAMSTDGLPVHTNFKDHKAER